MHGKYKNGKVWGGSAIKTSPKKFQLKDTLIKLPPLN